MNTLADESIVVSKRGTPALTEVELRPLLRQLPDWLVRHENGADQLQRVYMFSNFATALQFANAVGASAEEANHHPALLIEWGRVKVSWWTHTLQGLHRNDFIMAARCDALYSSPVTS
jgi:4a-hydroxytetrahydrobiopterin dehydratase